MDEIPMEPEPDDGADAQVLEPSGEAEAEVETPTEAASAHPKSRWKKRALWAGGIAAGIAAAVLVYLKAKAEQEEPEDDYGSGDGLYEDDFWAEDDDLDDEDDDEDWIVDQDLRDYLDEQEEIVGKLITEVETLDEDEWQSLYEQLDVDHQIQASDDLADWADDAVGHPSWRSDE